MQKKLWIVGVVAVVIVAGGLIAAKNSSGPDMQGGGSPKFRLALNTWVGFGPLWLAQDKGFFKDENVDVEMTVIEDPTQSRAALKSGALDGIADTTDSTLLARSQGVPLAMVTQIDFSNGADGILAVDSIKSVKDLKGKTIAVQRNFVSESWLNYVLVKNGVVPSEVTLLDTEAGAAGAAFAAGKVDIAVTWEPWLSKAKERAGGRVLISTRDIPGVVADVLSVSDEYRQKNPDAVKGILKAYFRAIEYWEAYPMEANELMAKHYNESAVDFADQISGIVWPSGVQAKEYFGTPSKPGSIYDATRTFADIFVKTGQIKGSVPDVTGAIDGSFLNEIF